MTRRRGVFLLEIVMALGILAMAAGAVTGAAVDASRRSQRLEDGLDAELLARSWLEVLRGLDPDDARDLAAAPDPERFLESRWPDLLPNPAPSEVELHLDLGRDEVTAGLVHFQVRVSWERADRPGDLRVSTLVRSDS
jgi:type II secretory pathway pseudopilin PulG